MIKSMEEMSKEELIQELKEEKSICETFYMVQKELRKEIKELKEYINKLNKNGD